MKQAIFFILLFTTIAYSQPVDSSGTGSIDSSVVSNLISDSLNNFRLQADTILTGTIIIPLGADSVIVTTNLGSVVSISNINVSPQENYQGMSYWVQDVTANTFKIKMGTTIAFDNVTEAISFSWQIFNADVSNLYSDEVINVKQSGLLGDNSAGDDTRLETIITDSGNKTYYFPKGTYNLSNFDLALTKPLKIIGEDKDSTIIVFDKSDRTVGFTINNSLHIENITIKSGARAIKIPSLGKEIDYFILKNVKFDDIVEKCVTGFRTSSFAASTRFNYGLIENCEVVNSDGGFRLENMFKTFIATNNRFYNVYDTIPEPRSVGYNNGASAFYIGDLTNYGVYDSGSYSFSNNSFQHIGSTLGQRVTGVSDVNNTLYIADNQIDSNEVLIFRSDGTLPSPITIGSEYRVVYSHNDTIKISLTSGGSPLNITTAGTFDSMYAYVPMETHAVLVYGKNITIDNNIVDDIVTDIKYESEVFYVRALSPAHITNNIIRNAGTGDGIIALKTGGLGENSTISNNTIYKDNNDYNSAAIYSKVFADISNNTIILKGTSTDWISTGDGIYFDCAYDTDRRMFSVNNNTIYLDEGDAIKVKSISEGQGVITGNNIVAKGNAGAFYMVVDGTYGLLNTVKFNNNVIYGTGGTRFLFRGVSDGAEMNNNTITLDSVTALSVNLQSSLGNYFDFQGNKFNINSVQDNSISLFQISTTEDIDVNIKNNQFFFNDGITYPILLASTSTIKNLRVTDNTIQLADTGSYPLSNFVYLDGDVTEDVMIGRNTSNQSTYNNIQKFIQARSSDIGGDLVIKDNKIESDVFMVYRDSLNVTENAIIQNNIYNGTVFLDDYNLASFFTYNNSSIRNNLGFKTTGIGTATLENASDSIKVAHSLSIIPDIRNIALTPQQDMDTLSYWVEDSTLNASTFEIKVSDNATKDYKFTWQIFDLVTAQPFNPRNYDQYTIALYDADLGLSDTLWEDKKNSYDFTLTGTPTITSNAINGHDALLLDGVNDRGTTLTMGLAQPFTYYIVFKQVSWTDGEHIIGGTNSTTSGTLIQSTSSPNFGGSAGSPSGLTNDLPIGTYGVVTAVWNGASSLIQVNDSTAITGDFGASNPAGIIIGDRPSGSRNSNIEIAYIVIRNTADDSSTRTLFKNFLIERFGL